MKAGKAIPFAIAVALLGVALCGSARADGERGTRAEAAQYAAREADAPGLQEFVGGVGGIVAAIVAFFSDALQAIVDLFSSEDAEPGLGSPGEQGRVSPTGLPEPA